MTTYTGKNLDTALQKASQATGTAVDALKYEILAGKTGGYALIKVTGAVAAVAAAPAAALVESLSGTPGEGGGGGEERPREDRPRRDDRRGGGGGERGGERRESRGGDRGGDRGPPPRRDDRGGDRGPPRRDDRGGGGDRGPRRDDRGGDRGPRRDDRGGDRGGGERRGRREENDLPLVPADGPTAVTFEIEGELSAFGRKVQEVLAGLLQRMQFGAGIKMHETADEVIVDMSTGPYHEVLIHRELEVLDAIEHLLEKAIHLPEEAGEDGRAPRKKIHLDTNGQRAKADVDLAQSAKHMAERAVEERRTFKLGPLDPRARRVVHMTLREVTGVITKSEGEGVFRRVCIIPKGVEGAESNDGADEGGSDE